MKPSISILNGKIWVSWGTEHSIEITQISDFRRASDGGQLPNQLTDREIEQLLKRCHKLRSPQKLSRISYAPSTLIALSLVLSVFWLGSGLMYQIQNIPFVPPISDSAELPLPVGASCSVSGSSDVIPGYNKELHSSLSKQQSNQIVEARETLENLSDVSTGVSKGTAAFGYSQSVSDAATHYSFGYGE